MCKLVSLLSYSGGNCFNLELKPSRLSIDCEAIINKVPNLLVASITFSAASALTMIALSIYTILIIFQKRRDAMRYAGPHYRRRHGDVYNAAPNLEDPTRNHIPLGPATAMASSFTHGVWAPLCKEAFAECHLEDDQIILWGFHQQEFEL